MSEITRDKAIELARHSGMEEASRERIFYGASAQRAAVIRGSAEYVSWFPIMPTVRPCDLPGGCNARNCLGCGEAPAGVNQCAEPQQENRK